MRRPYPTDKAMPKWKGRTQLKIKYGISIRDSDLSHDMCNSHIPAHCLNFHRHLSKCTLVECIHDILSKNIMYM